MDADTRHQLRTNELGEALRHLSNPRVIYAALAIGVVALAWVGFRIFNYQKQQANAAAWHALSQIRASDPSLGNAPIDELRALKDAGNSVGLAAAAQLRMGLGLKFRARGAPALRADALTSLESLSNDNAVPPTFRAAALYNLGMLHEDVRAFDQAKAAYTRLSIDAVFAGSPFAEMARSRMEAMENLLVPIPFEEGYPEIVFQETPPPTGTETPATAPATEQPAPPAADDAGPDAPTATPDTQPAPEYPVEPTTEPASDAPAEPAADPPASPSPDER